MFDLNLDPMELNDLASAFPETTLALRTFLADWHNSIRIADLNRDDGNDEKRLEQLRSLGYIN